MTSHSIKVIIVVEGNRINELVKEVVEITELDMLRVAMVVPLVCHLI